MAELELNKIVGMIMENPELVEKIKAMGDAAAAREDAPHELADEIPASTPAPTPVIPHRKSKRNELLGALRSFLSEPRQKSLETMMTLADVLDTVRQDRGEK